MNILAGVDKNNENLVICYPLRLSREEFERVKLFAREEDLNGAQFIRRSIRQAIERRQKRTRNLDTEAGRILIDAHTESEHDR